MESQCSNRVFREKFSAADFIHEFKRVTIIDPHTMFRILKKDVFKDTSDDSEEMCVCKLNSIAVASYLCIAKCIILTILYCYSILNV